MDSKPGLPIAVMISGGGTTLKNLLAEIDQGRCPADVKLVLSSSGQAGGNALATERGIPLVVAERRQFESDENYSEKLFAAVRQAGIRYVILGGFLKRLVIPADFENRVVNIHPSLIPAFCGKGMYGMRVHQAVIDYGCKLSGCTVHFVDNQYDHGPIIAQSAVPVLHGDTAQQLQQRVFREECRIYPEVIRWIANDRVRCEGRGVSVLGEEVQT
jgi:phosphoribosylglycinamide formyltransferase-1